MTTTTSDNDAQLPTDDLQTVCAKLLRSVAETATEYPGAALLAAERARLTIALQERSEA